MFTGRDLHSPVVLGICLPACPWLSGTVPRIRSLMCAKDKYGVFGPNFSAAFPASLSARSLPRTPDCPLTPSDVGRPGSMRRDLSVDDTQSPPPSGLAGSRDGAAEHRRLPASEILVAHAVSSSVPRGGHRWFLTTSSCSTTPFSDASVHESDPIRAARERTNPKANTPPFL